MNSHLERLLAPLRSRVLGMVARAVVRKVDDAHKLQELQLAILGQELAGRAERFQPYGLTSVPLPGAEAVVVFAQGNRDHPLVVAVDDRNDRPQGLAAGEVLLYGRLGQRVHLRADGSIRVASTGLVLVEADQVEVDAASSLTLSCGSSSIELNPAGVTITGALVNINPP